MDEIAGVFPVIIAEGMRVLKQAFAHVMQIMFIIGVPSRVTQCIGCCF